MHCRELQQATFLAYKFAIPGQVESGVGSGQAGERGCLLFLQRQIQQLADAVGFHYKRDPRTGQFIHSAAIMIATPQGKLAQYYYGVEFSPKDLRLGLIEVSRNKIGNLVDQVTLYCYHYDPTSGRYGAAITNILRLGGAATVLLLGGFLIVMYRREPHDSRKGAGRA